jgi:hypothetical protein
MALLETEGVVVNRWVPPLQGGGYWHVKAFFTDRLPLRGRCFCYFSIATPKLDGLWYAAGFGESRIGLVETFQVENKAGRILLQKLNQDYCKQEDLTSWKKTC